MRALILGSGYCLWDDVEEVERLVGREWDGLVIACNDAGVLWPRFLDHWVTMHPEQYRLWPNTKVGLREEWAAAGRAPEAYDDWAQTRPGWVEQRAMLGHPDGFVRWARRNPDMVDRIVQTWGGGSSGLLAVATAEKLGATHAILCGMPMDRTPHVNDHHKCGSDPWMAADNHWRAWVRSKARRRMETWVRSMNGRTREHLGAPTLDWLDNGGRNLEAA